MASDEKKNMFAVYGLSGPIYQGTFEGLKDVAGVHRGAAVRPIAEGEPAPVFSAPVAQAVSTSAANAAAKRLKKRWPAAELPVSCANSSGPNCDKYAFDRVISAALGSRFSTS